MHPPHSKFRVYHPSGYGAIPATPEVAKGLPKVGEELKIRSCIGFVGSYLARVTSFRATLTEFRTWTAPRGSVLREEGLLSLFKRFKRG